MLTVLANRVDTLFQVWSIVGWLCTCNLESVFGRIIRRVSIVNFPKMKSTGVFKGDLMYYNDERMDSWSDHDPNIDHSWYIRMVIAQAMSMQVTR